MQVVAAVVTVVRKHKTECLKQEVIAGSNIIKPHGCIRRDLQPVFTISATCRAIYLTIDLNGLVELASLKVQFWATAR